MARLRGRPLLLMDLIAVLVAGYLALALRYDQLVVVAHYVEFLAIVVPLVLIRLGVNARLGLYSTSWRHASVPDLARVAGAVAVGTLIAGTLYLALWLPHILHLTAVPLASSFPESFWAIEAVLTLGLLGGLRFMIRATSDMQAAAAARPLGQQKRTLLYGAGQVGALMARSAYRSASAGVAPIGFLDDDPALAGRTVAGLKVLGGLEAMPSVVRETGAEALLITMTAAPGSTIRRVVDAALALDLEVRTVPSIDRILDGTVEAHHVRKVRVEDLLRRPLAMEHASAVQEAFGDKVVMITGAGGSIGSELARQVLSLGPRRLILVDRAESPLYLVERQLEEQIDRGRGSGELRLQLANVASRPMISRLVATERPDVILHAAAYKHVPLMETHPADAVVVNVGGTMALLDAAAACGVGRFVLVSTDKAVRPSSVMGASKRVAEMLVADTARRTGLPYVSVRFGNVLGSNGSVVPIFQEQLENGRPLTVTHPDMTRYFMTIPEASWLILDAAALGSTGDLFVLDMGEPIKVMDIARDLARLAGRDPDTQPIEIIGLRPGEKLHEELFYDAEQVEQTNTPKVLRAISGPPPQRIREYARELQELAMRDDTTLRAALHCCARGLAPNAITPVTERLRPVPIAVEAADSHDLYGGVAGGAA
jgi:FlaA1/EpsC-like NDP-sugar epimerase